MNQRDPPAQLAARLQHAVELLQKEVGVVRLDMLEDTVRESEVEALPRGMLVLFDVSPCPPALLLVPRRPAPCPLNRYPARARRASPP
jgi:hypothetical protein